MVAFNVDSQRRFLVSSAEDLVLAGTKSAMAIASRLAVTVQTRGWEDEFTEAELLEITLEGLSNVARGKKTRPNFLGFY
jgi:hypothetical protein